MPAASSKESLERDGALFEGANGVERVHVTLQVEEPIPITRQSRDAVHQELCRKFEEIERRWAAEGLELEMSSLSELSQAVRASLPFATFDKVSEALSASESVRIDPVVRRQAARTDGGGACARS